VIALGELLNQRGIAFDVLSRGYRRTSSQVAIVDPQGSPEQFGDEPLLITRKLQVPLVVGADRYRAGLLAEKQFDTKLHLLDDAFQHRRLHRDFDIVVLPASDLHDALLPLGRLREPLSALRRADAAVVTEKLDEADAQRVRNCMRAPENMWAARRVLELDQPMGKAVVFCGIARPEQFLSQLKALEVDIAAAVQFRDHHRYSQSDIERLLKTKQDARAECFITTEKDEINLGPFATRLAPLRVARLRVALEPGTVVSTVLSTLEQRCSCRF
jgi:tetraacyldisaccharide 4'-kinase